MKRKIIPYGLDISVSVRPGAIYQTVPNLSLTIKVKGGYAIVNGSPMGEVAHVPKEGIFELVQTDFDEDAFLWEIRLHWDRKEVERSAAVTYPKDVRTLIEASRHILGILLHPTRSVNINDADRLQKALLPFQNGVGTMPMEPCREAPDGWQCLREAGHAGPCAAQARTKE